MTHTDSSSIMAAESKKSGLSSALSRLFLDGGWNPNVSISKESLWRWRWKKRFTYQVDDHRVLKLLVHVLQLAPRWHHHVLKDGLRVVFHQPAPGERASKTRSLYSWVIFRDLNLWSSLTRSAGRPDCCGTWCSSCSLGPSCSPPPSSAGRATTSASEGWRQMSFRLTQLRNNEKDGSYCIYW